MEELIKLGANKAINEYTWKTIECIFKPINFGSLMLRVNYHNYKELVHCAFIKAEPNPLILQGYEEFKEWKRLVNIEMLYRQCKYLHLLKIRIKGKVIDD